MSEIKLKADTGGGTVSLKGPAQTTGDADFPLTLPVNDGAADEVLTTNGSGTLTWAAAAAGATGGSTDKIFWENGQTVTTDYTVGTTFGAACNAVSAGPITINSGKTVQVDAGEYWIII